MVEGHAKTFTRLLVVALAGSVPLLLGPESMEGQALSQDGFGRAVSVSGSDVLVSKPGAAQGPATIYVFRRGADGSWSVVDELSAPEGSGAGEGFSPTMAAAGETVLVGSGDADAFFGAHAFAIDGGRFAYAGRLPLDPEASAEPAGGAVDLGTVMRILSPPSRPVATDGVRAAVSLVSGGLTTPGVRVLERSGDDGGWTIRAEISPPDLPAGTSFGHSLALDDDLLVVGAPGFGGSGAAMLYERNAQNGDWSEIGPLAPDSFPPGSRVGEAVAIIDGTVLVSAPRARDGASVLVFERRSDGGGWGVTQRIRSPDPDARDLFGVALAASGTELWVGAPRADDAVGAVYRYRRVERTGEWEAHGALTAPGAEPGFGLGSAVALGEAGVVGAPGADGGRGRAAVFSRDGDAWRSDGWVVAGSELERIADGEVTCADGDAAGFDCHDVDLLAFLPISAIGGEPGETVSDVWGWTDPETGREYALLGRTGGAAIVDVSDPSGASYLGVVAANPSGARDLKVYRDHLFFTGDGAGNHGLVIFDLTRLRDVGETPTTFEPDTVYRGIASAHNLVLDTESGFAFPVGSSGGGETCGGGLHMVDVRDPMNPTFAGCYTDTHGLIAPGRTHDAQCTVYSGPDEPYRGREICFVSNETALRVVDVTDKANPLPISAASYPGMAYIHQGWLTDDQRYYYLNDELDELVGNTDRTRTFIWDVSELDDPVLVGHVDGPDAATDHNLYVKGDRMYQANYQAGMRVFDISDPEAPFEIGFFDTTPYEGNPPGFNGAWTAYPFFESGTVVVSSIHEGLFVLRPRRRALIP